MANQLEIRHRGEIRVTIETLGGTESDRSRRDCSDQKLVDCRFCFFGFGVNFTEGTIGSKVLGTRDIT